MSQKDTSHLAIKYGSSHLLLRIDMGVNLVRTKRTLKRSRPLYQREADEQLSTGGERGSSAACNANALILDDRPGSRYSGSKDARETMYVQNDD